MKCIDKVSFEVFFVQIGTTSCGAVLSLYAILAVISTAF